MWRTGQLMTTQLVLDALEQAIWTRDRAHADVRTVVAHSVGEAAPGRRR